MTQGARKVDGKLVLWIENVVSYMAVKNHIYPAKPATHTHTHTHTHTLPAKTQLHPWTSTPQPIPLPDQSGLNPNLTNDNDYDESLFLGFFKRT